ncbi:MAG: hypothetical protein RSD47_10840, partial [Romboutsia sp.]
MKNLFFKSNSSLAMIAYIAKVVKVNSTMYFITVSRNIENLSNISGVENSVVNIFGSIKFMQINKQIIDRVPTKVLNKYSINLS